MSFSIKDCPWETIIKVCKRLNIETAKHVLGVSLGEQKLYHITNGSPTALYPVSTSRRPPSCIKDSFGTPLGLHEIAEKIGSGVSSGSVFTSRVCTDRYYSEFSPEELEKNLITSRILWLRGLEPGRNQGPGCDSHDRYIYIHGTNHEDLIGAPQSSGCVQMTNRDIIKLFDAIEPGTHVWIG